MDNKGDITSVLTYEGALPRKRFIDNLVSKDKYISLQTLHKDLNIVRCTARITPYDDTKATEEKLSRAYSTLNEIMIKMNSTTSLYKRLSIGGMGIGTVVSIVGIAAESGWGTMAGLTIGVVSASILNSVYHKQRAISDTYDLIVDDCKKLEETVLDNKNTYLIK